MENRNSIFDLLDWNESKERQEEGVRLALQINDLSIFIQPCTEKHGKNIWDNCALILSQKTNEELSPYLPKLLEWIQDLNWPGAEQIMERLSRFDPKELVNPFISCYTKAVLDEDIMWICWLKELLEKSHLTELLPTKIVDEIKQFVFD